MALTGPFLVIINNNNANPKDATAKVKKTFLFKNISFSKEVNRLDIRVCLMVIYGKTNFVPFINKLI